MQAASFADSIHKIRKSVVKNEELPEARAIANIAISRNPFKCRTKFHGNMVGVMFGQLMAHDQGLRQMCQTRTNIQLKY